ncbi:GNAT family N-acetyltransferase [Paenibacillus sp. JDR-2]|uniref:GNAT family N-acetyltransferase n=1 Tax=Paenibacillus sp. (strain JDR-2) TaxID=324057 RepID=UPI0001666CE7|nr:GNAT family protein [Paenibacillus sp. JDR-2]ACT01209.1 GCN5-related N-acetyltransferase [Paenibacillus sp. JDR-2]
MSFQHHFTTFPVLETERLILRSFTQNDSTDADALFLMLSDSESAKFFGNTPMDSKEKAVLLIGRSRQRFESMEMIRWAITLKDNGTVIGMVIARDFELEAAGDLEYIILPEYWGKGYMTEALRAVIAYGFDILELKRLQAKVMPENVASLAVLRKLHFQQEGLLRQYPFGLWITDTLMFSLLDSEWK